jgi:16S rRNA (guanine966-N2)-methyltransferase
MSLRIIGGSARGRRLVSPPGKNVRPTGDRVREAVFNILGQNFEGWSLIDVCSGSGAVSLEAISRGAERVVALESSEERCRHIQDEAERLDFGDRLDIRRGDARNTLSNLRREGSASFDVAFVDPPWAEEALRREILDLLFPSVPLCAMAVCEFPGAKAEPDAPVGARKIRRVDYSGTSLVFFEAALKDTMEGE